jgi:hypothetical protein
MNRVFSPRGLGSEFTSGSLAWPHLQRLAERWLRRWGYALTGLALGWSGMWLARPEVSEAHASAVQAVANLTQQLDGTPAGPTAPTPAQIWTATDKSATDAQRLLQALPAGSQPEHVWISWQQTLAAHGLRLQSLQPIPPTSTQGRSGALVSHAAAWRALGRFEDWARVWAACAESGPVCTLERIQVVATEQAAEVQIDAVMRVWMRPAEKSAADVAEQAADQPTGEAVQADWMADGRTDVRRSQRSRVALFAPGLDAGAVAAQAHAGLAQEATPLANANATLAAASGADLPDDPHQWPYTRVRLAGLWQQGDARLAVLSAGPHSVRVVPGQRVSLEGHRVVDITDVGVDLRLGQGPVLPLAWADPLQLGAPAEPAPQLSTRGSRTK